MIKFFQVLILLLVPISLFAGSDCSVQSFKSIRSVQLRDPEIPCGMANEVDALVNKVQMALKPPFTPELYVLELFTKTSETLFRPPYFLQLPQQTFAVASGAILYTHDQTRTHWVHEIGHSLFSAFLKEKFPWFRKLHQRRIQWAKYLEQATALEKEIQQHRTAALEKKLAQVSKQANKARVAIFPTALDLKLDELIAPYDEFMADLTAIIFYKKANAMYESFLFAEMGESELNNIRFRDLSASFEKEKWEAELKKFPNDPYLTLAPFKEFFYKTYLQDKTDPLTAELYKKTITIVTEEIVTRFAKPDGFNLSPEEINHRLIERFSTQQP